MAYEVIGKKHVRITEEDNKRKREVFEVGEIMDPTEEELNAFGDKFRHIPDAQARQRQQRQQARQDQEQQQAQERREDQAKQQDQEREATTTSQRRESTTPGTPQEETSGRRGGRT